MYSPFPICIVCLNKSLEYIDLETPFDVEPVDEEVQAAQSASTGADKVFTYLDCFRACTRLEAPDSALNVSLSQSLCDACGQDLKVTYNFLRKAESANKILSDAAKISKLYITNAEEVELEDLKACIYEEAQQEEDSAKQSLVNEMEMEDAEAKGTIGTADISGTRTLHTVIEVDPLDEKMACECSFCEETFFSMTALNVHTSRMHPDSVPAKAIYDNEVLDTLEIDAVQLVDEMTAYAYEQEESEQNETMQNADVVANLEEDSVDSQYVSDLTVNSNFKCAHCSRQYNNRGLLMQHLWQHHKRPLRNTCKICQPTIIGNKSPRKHMKSAHSHTVQCGKRNYKCKESKLRDQEQREDSDHHGFRCKFCPKTFMTSASLNAHINHHLRKPAKSDACSVCGKQFSSNSYLKRHMAVHRERRAEHECPQCDRVYLTKSALDTHLRMHNGNTQQCPECGKGFVRAYELEVHMRFHNRTFPFVCEVCGKSFAIKGHLRSHMWRHQGLKLQCEECGKLFGSTKAQLEHSFSHTSMPFPCSRCDKGYPSKQKYKAHLKTVHLVELDKNELQKIELVPKPRRRQKLTLVQADSVMKEVEVKSKEDGAGEDVEELLDNMC